MVAARAGALGDHGRGGHGHAGQVLGVPDRAADGLPWRRWAVMTPPTRAGVSKSGHEPAPAALLHLCKWSSHLASAPFMRRNSRAATAASRAFCTSHVG